MHALKVRTNRSYEALANRIGVSSSTLHRYCSGETVPSNYEVIARFGRVCGASNAEAEELLQSWVLTVNGHREPSEHTHTHVPAAPTESARVPGQPLRWFAVVTIAGVLGAVMRRHRAARE
jgi:transcriptional regulator with XRE-family HTH domain